jgi:hypothetical protein
VRRLTPDALDALLAQLQPVLNDIVLIGGQALNLG